MGLWMIFAIYFPVLYKFSHNHKFRKRTFLKPEKQVLKHPEGFQKKIRQPTSPHLHLLHPTKLVSFEVENYLLLPSPLLSHLSLPVLQPRGDKIPTSTEYFISHGGSLWSYIVCRMLCFYGPLIKLWERMLPQPMLEAEQKTRLEKCTTHWTGKVR